MPARDDTKPCIFMGSSRRDLGGFPEDVRGEIGHALYEPSAVLSPSPRKR